MAKGNPVKELAAFFKQLPGAPKHLKVMMIIAVVMLAGSGLGAYRSLPSEENMPLAQTLLLTAAVGAMLWVVGFLLGFMLRKEPLKPTFPPYEQIGKGAAPSLVAGLGCGTVVGNLGLGVSPGKAVACSCGGWLVVMIVTIGLFRLYTPVTAEVVQRTQQLGIIVSDAYRGMWVFPALGALALFLGVSAIDTDLEILKTVAVTSSMATSVTLAGVASGFLP